MATVQIPFSHRSNPSSPFAHKFSTHHKFPSPPPPSTFSHPHPNNVTSPSRWNSPAKRKHEGADDYPDDEHREQDSTQRRIAGGKRVKRGDDTIKPNESDRQAIPGSMEVKNEMEDVDVGVLLASVPQSSLLPLLNALINDNPSLKPKVISLMPRPSIGAVTAALGAAYQKVQAAYPYSSSTPTFSGGGFGMSFQPIAPSSFGFGSAFGTPLSLQASGLQQPRDSFARARLRQPLAEFVTTVLSYLPYFSLTPATSASSVSASSKQQPHAGETFTYLHQAAQYALQLLPLFGPPTPPPADLVDLIQRLHTEVTAWSQAVAVHVNKNGGMFGSDMVQTWSRGLDELAQLGGEQWGQLRDEWVQQCGWLIGRRLH
ncbi:hypothetical protein DACRYDRAFT_22939 [Dacryopinax primogenitus]|uniref:Tethering factor for nuclear proteasome STS1 n=1 Tax=Dacryopinax primogenitus (strain DJM 731) TaxID=1858805 RepID=M5GB66_DACPD|nr:uncharacterized protein DACRYDRAFT_22939 [Dacryopinax primogenitus]EJU01193.1 hypothetical protein DACRYDRAFT_22939 [Dacryopinax primogenitus]